ncbi:CAP domain-containing protein [Singulisphaera sp. PoT]|uniref:CAP domain-containing protein n=1 Tax=Singulisphaera sp. PoT TaxID=3411797 RepID=UPI003BF5C49C
MKESPTPLSGSEVGRTSGIVALGEQPRRKRFRNQGHEVEHILMTIDRHSGMTRRMALGLFALGSGCTSSQRHAQPIESAPIPGGSDSSESILASLISAHNQERTSARLPALSENEWLVNAASLHARDMADHGRMSHQGSDRSSPFQRMERVGYRFRAAAENIAMGDFTLESLMRAWMTSPGHRRNILGNYNDIGAAYATASDGRTYWCVTFGTPMGR